MSAGYHRMGANNKRKGLQWDNKLFDPSQDGQTIVATSADLPVDDEPPSIGFRAVLRDPSTFEPGPLRMTREQAAQQGFTGNQCNNCGSMQMKVSGHCEVCSECGTTTGCS